MLQALIETILNYLPGYNVGRVAPRRIILTADLAKMRRVK